MADFIKPHVTATTKSYLIKFDKILFKQSWSIYSIMIVVSGLMYVLNPDLRNLRAGAVEQLPPTHAVSVADDDD